MLLSAGMELGWSLEGRESARRGGRQDARLRGGYYLSRPLIGKELEELHAALHLLFWRTICSPGIAACIRSRMHCVNALKAKAFTLSL